jgi:hypothetical protein
MLCVEKVPSAGTVDIGDDVGLIFSGILTTSSCCMRCPKKYAKAPTAANAQNIRISINGNLLREDGVSAGVDTSGADVTGGAGVCVTAGVILSGDRFVI